MSQIEDIAIHVDTLSTDEMRKHACTGPEGDHDLPFQIFRYLVGYDEALTEARAYKQGAACDSKIIHEQAAEIERLASAIIDARDFLVTGQKEEAYHRLYEAANPEFDSLEPWKELEAKAAKALNTSEEGGVSIVALDDLEMSEETKQALRDGFMEEEEGYHG